MNIYQIESRGMYSPPNGNHPQALPDLWEEGGIIRTDLPELTDEVLNSIGWKGPIQMPPLPGTSYYTHDYQWNKETREYDAIEVSEYDKQKRVDYQKFWDTLLRTSTYSTIKVASTQSLQTNTIVTEFIALITDAKRGQANIEKLQQSFIDIISNISFTSEEFSEIQEIFMQSGMFAIYTLS
jgi:hypothetical protein